VTLPRFPLHDDPGPNFSRLVRSYGLAPDYTAVTKDAEISHATTVVACTFVDGVVIAGDRRATSGNLISHRNMKKVFPADRWSGVAIAGAAGPAVEMIKMFQLQLEHYEKIEGNPLTLEGKANQLSMMVRANLQAAMMGLVVVPIFAGYDRRRQRGRVWAYDVTGGSYEETNHVASGSGSLHARTVIKLGHRPTQSQDEAVDLLIRALFTAADEDSATGGPDQIRNIYPIVATITVEGYEELDEPQVAARFGEYVRSLSTPSSTEA
jgi:proteasome beta subunit